ncbi:MAG: hypothetical protein H5U22_06320 [Rhizobium sp.]|nr:hypothetical protein [Rhizobium sp.]
MEFLKNLFVGFVASAMIVGGALSYIGATFMFAHWLSGGALWGILIVITLNVSAFIGVMFAVGEAKP